MSFLLAQWLNKEIGVSLEVAPIELDSVLKSGRLLGEVLYKLELIDDLDEYMSGTSLEASIKNYTLAERILKERLGITLSSNEAFDLIQGRAGCAAKLLYQIKGAHSRLPIVDPLDQKLNFKLGSQKRKGNIDSYPSSPTGKSFVSNINKIHETTFKNICP